MRTFSVGSAWPLSARLVLVDDLAGHATEHDQQKLKRSSTTAYATELGRLLRPESTTCATAPVRLLMLRRLYLVLSNKLLSCSLTQPNVKTQHDVWVNGELTHSYF